MTGSDQRRETQVSTLTEPVFPESLKHTLKLDRLCLKDCRETD
jgi:hypothetical protein